MKALSAILPAIAPLLLCAEEAGPLPGHSHVGEAFDEGPRSALKAAPLALTVPARAATAYLRGVHRLDEVRAHEASRFAVAISAMLVFATIFGIAAAVVLYAVL